MSKKLWYILALPEVKKLMKENDKLLYKTMKSLLNERLSELEEISLRDEGFFVKRNAIIRIL